MEDIQLRYVFDRLRTANNSTKKGLLNIEVRKTGSNEKVLLSTGIHLYKNQFSDTNGFTCRNHDNALIVTSEARKFFKKIETFAFSDKCTKLKDVRNWDKEPSGGYSFIDFIRSELSRNDPSMSVTEYHESLITRLKEFGKIRTFKDITYENIVDFDTHLRITIKSQPTLYKRHSALHRYIREAVNRGLCAYDPYIQFRTHKGKTKEPVFLLENEIQKVSDWTPANDKLAHVKDLFLFQIFTGMAYVDMAHFDKSYISELDGYKVIRSSRQKTDESFISLFLPEAERIADKYDYRLPVMSNQRYNDYLKLLAAGAGINKNLTSHAGRHTYATYLLNKGIPIETVSRAMGHSNIKMTQHYARLLGKKVVSDMAILLNKDDK
jgi:site-specific recombinase XerD